MAKRSGKSSSGSGSGKSVFVFACINIRVDPMDRGEMFEDPMIELLDGQGVAELTGGGCEVSEDGEIASVGLDFEVFDEKKGFTFLKKELTKLGAPKGSYIEYKDKGKAVKESFGLAEGLALYLNGTDLPMKVYKANDPNKLCKDIMKAIDGVGFFVSSWEGSKETALYFYGKFAEMKDRMQSVLAKNPLCEKCRVVQIA